MEILNNFWMAISTPNEMLINVILLIGIFIENFLILLLFTNIQKIYPPKSKKLIYVLSMSFLGILTMYIIPSPFNIFLNFFLPIGIAYIIFKTSLLKTITVIIIALIYFNLIGILILNPFITFFNIDSNQLNNIPTYRLLYMSIMYFFTLIAIFFLKFKNIKLDFMEYLNTKNKLIITANLFFGIIAIIVQSITLFYYVDKLPIFITFLSFISLLVYFGISIYSLTRIFKLILTTRKLESAESYNHSLRILHDNVRGFKHDFDNIVTTIGG